MTNEEEFSSFEALRNGDESMRETIFMHNRGYVIHLALRFKGSRLPLEDLVQEGNYGMLRALDKFDHTRGIRFVLYARWWITQAMQSASMSQPGAVTLPKRLWTETRAAIKEQNRLMEGRSPNHGPSPAEVVEATGQPLPVAIAAQTMRYGNTGAFVSRDGDEIDDDRMVPESMRSMPNQDEHMAKDDVKRAIEGVLESAREIGRTKAEVYGNSVNGDTNHPAIFLDRYYGLTTGESETLEEIGKEYGITKERVRQINADTIGRIRTLRKYKDVMDMVSELVG